MEWIIIFVTGESLIIYVCIVGKERVGELVPKSGKLCGDGDDFVENEKIRYRSVADADVVVWQSTCGWGVL